MTGPPSVRGDKAASHNLRRNVFRPKLTYANVVATLALFIALGGASYAAIKLPKNSVGTKQLKKNAVTTAKLKKGAVTAAKLKPGRDPDHRVRVQTTRRAPTARRWRGMGRSESTSIAPGSIRLPKSFRKHRQRDQIFSSDGLTFGG